MSKCDQRSQAARILEYLCTGERLTSLEALRKFGTLRLGARIYDLRTHHDIRSRMVKRGARTVAEYWLVRS